MLIEKGKFAYISDNVVDGVVTMATRYINLRGRYTRVGDSVEIKGKYKDIHIHNVKARHSFNELPDLEAEELEKEVLEDVVTAEIKEDVTVTDEGTTPTEEIVEVTPVVETVEPKHEYTFIVLKAMTKPEQNAIAKSLGLKGYHNLPEDTRIDMILDAK